MGEPILIVLPLRFLEAHDWQEFQQAEAESLWEAMAGSTTEQERDTARYLLNKYSFEAGAHTYLNLLVDPPPAALSDVERQRPDGALLDTRLLEQEARRQRNDDDELGRLQAGALWGMAWDCWSVFRRLGC